MLDFSKLDPLNEAFTSGMMVVLNNPLKKSRFLVGHRWTDHNDHLTPSERPRPRPCSGSRNASGEAILGVQQPSPLRFCLFFFFWGISWLEFVFTYLFQEEIEILLIYLFFSFTVILKLVCQR